MFKKSKSFYNNYLQNFFNENYGQFASTYLNRRLDYITNHIGILGYNVYIRNDFGEEQYLGFTTDTYYNYITTKSGNHTFIVRATYSIFNANASKGLTITVKSNTGVNTPIIPDDDLETETPIPGEDNEEIPTNPDLDNDELITP